MIDTEAVIGVAASDVFRRFRSYVDRDDLIQEGYLWTVLHPARLRKFQEDENERNAAFQCRTELASFMERYARREKAAALGYDTEDEYRYGKAQVETLISAVLHGDTDPPRQDASAGRVNTDPAEGNNFLVMKLDVEQAWARANLSEEDRLVVILKYLDGYTDTKIAEEMGWSRQTVSARLNRCIRMIVRELGSENPKDCPYDCECHEGKLRLRPGTHSEISGANQLTT